MRARSFFCLAAFLGCLLTFSACRKDLHYAIDERNGVSSGLLVSAKNWHSQNIDPEFTGTRLKPLWEDAWTLKSGVLVVPAPEHPSYNPKITIRRFFVFASSRGSVTDGRIIEFLGNEYDVSANVDFLVHHIDKDYIDSFSGSILRYDINYRALSNSTFAEGRKLNNVFTSMVTMTGEEIMRLQKSQKDSPAPSPKQ